MAKLRNSIFLVIGIVILAACGSTEANDPLAGAEAPDPVVETDDSLVDDSANISEAPEAIATADQTAQSVEATTTTTTAPTETTSTGVPSTTTTTTEAPVETCSAPTQAVTVDVALDDADGGLNMRSGPGTSNEVIATFARGKELFTTGECTPVNATDWWQVTTSDGGQTGWVSSRFLTDSSPLDFVLGPRVDDPNVDGLEATTSQGTIEILAERYGFDEDAVITLIQEGADDAQGGTAVYEITGLKDDAIDGYRFEILYFFTHADADAFVINGIDPARVETRVICSRAITPEGLCI